jgi:adenylate cyclase
MAEAMVPEEVAKLLNQYFSHIARACEWNHGLVDKYIGDCAMLVFGTPEPDEDHCFHGIRCALTVKHLIALENARREKAGHAPVRFRVGLNSGSMLAGNMGANERMEYTVVGDTVNLASRLSSVAKAGEIIITEATYNRPEIRDRVIARQQRSIQLRGIQQPVATYVVEGLIPSENEQLIRQVETLWWQARRHTA